MKNVRENLRFQNEVESWWKWITPESVNLMLDQLESKLNGTEGDSNGNLTTKNKDAK